jgi:VWFA-related protein
MWLPAAAQDLTRDLKVGPGDLVEVVNHYGRVSARAVAGPSDDQPAAANLAASSDKGVSDSEIKITGGGSRLLITVTGPDRGKRIDLVLTLPERTRLKVETSAGAIEASGNFALVEALTDTGTIAADVPAEDLKYQFLWTESRPRYLADFDIEKVKEKSAGRFEIKGRRQSEDVKSKKEKVKNEESVGDASSSEPVETTRPATEAAEPTQKKTKEEKAAEKLREKEARIKEKEDRLKEKSEERKAKKLAEAASRSVDLNFTTARGIILLNVPPNEVTSDLRERPLTEAAKAIVRSGDSLLMEAIRRASPKYFGDYSRTLPPFSREPSFAAKASGVEVPVSHEKTAVVRVTDVNNRAISGLGKGDFEVIENGAPREIVSVERSSAPFNLVLLLDVSGSVENYVNFIRKAARSFVDTVGERDRVSIVIFNEDVKVLSKFTTDKAALSGSLDTFDAGGGTAYYDALAYAVSDTLRPLKGERTAIVILTDGDDNRSFLAFDSLIGSIQESGALIYPLYVPSGLIATAAQNADIDPTRKKYMSLTAKSEGEGDRLAKVSGGVYYPITQIDQIQKAYEDIVLQMRSAYNITYRSDGAQASTNGGLPRLKVRAKRDNSFATVTSVWASGQNRER